MEGLAPTEGPGYGMSTSPVGRRGALMGAKHLLLISVTPMTVTAGGG